ncbi:putative pectate lyase B, partial [Lachnellula willkommii]
MKLSLLSSSLAILLQLTSAAPTPTSDENVVQERAKIAKRATITDIATTGYATQNGGTTGGNGGTVTTVSTLAQFTTAVTNGNLTPTHDVARIIVVSGTITGSVQVRVGSNKSIIGKSGATLVGVGLYINKSANVIVRNIISQKVLATNGDGIGIQISTNVWVDHCELSSDLDNGKDYYDGLVDITHASEWVTVSNSYLHDHFKASLIGHSDNNGAQDTGHLHVSQHNNYWENIGSRTPSIRFGT